VRLCAPLPVTPLRAAPCWTLLAGCRERPTPGPRRRAAPSIKGRQLTSNKIFACINSIERLFPSSLLWSLDIFLTFPAHTYSGPVCTLGQVLLLHQSAPEVLHISGNTGAPEGQHTPCFRTWLEQVTKCRPEGCTALLALEQGAPFLAKGR